MDADHMCVWICKHCSGYGSPFKQIPEREQQYECLWCLKHVYKFKYDSHVMKCCRRPVHQPRLCKCPDMVEENWLCRIYRTYQCSSCLVWIIGNGDRIKMEFTMHLMHCRNVPKFNIFESDDEESEIRM